MVVTPEDASLFLTHYSRLLYEVNRLSGQDALMEYLQLLNAGREAALAKPLLFDAAALSLEADGHAVPAEVLEAVQTMKVRHWIFLRDTSQYSIFIDPTGSVAYAVLGLTQPIREIVGGDAVTIRIGIVHFKGAYVCDGIVTSIVALSAKQKNEYSDKFRSLKASGRFHLG